MSNLLTKIRRLLLQIAYPITRFIGKIHLPWSQKKLKSNHYRKVVSLLQPGDVLLLRTDGEIANMFIPGYWTHAAMFCGGDYVVEAVGEGVLNTDMLDTILTRDAVMICRPSFATEEQRCDAAEWAKAQIGKGYDLFFNPNNDAFYCSELIWLAYERTMGAIPFTLRQTLGVDTVVPEDIAKARDKWDRIYNSKLQFKAA